jgi:hypothetical protein
VDDRRREYRRSTAVSFLIAVGAEPEAPAGGVGITFNMSECGAGFYSPRAFQAGEAIVLKRTEVFGQTGRTATVRWCDRVSKDVYRVGIAHC